MMTDEELRECGEKLYHQPELWRRAERMIAEIQRLRSLNAELLELQVCQHDEAWLEGFAEAAWNEEQRRCAEIAADLEPYIRCDSSFPGNIATAILAPRQKVA